MADCTSNSILAGLPEPDRKALLANAAREDVEQRYTFYDPEKPARAVWFVESGMASELIRSIDGRSVDTAPIGRDGLVGFPALFGLPVIHHCMMQVAGQVSRVPVAAVRNTLERSPEFRRLIYSLMEARHSQATQFAACNLLHPIEARLARWLLAARFHARTDTLNVTQQFVSEMLGANRSTVTLALGAMERAGLIEYQRAVVHIVDAAKLKNASCECYEVVEKVFAPLRQAGRSGVAHNA